MKKTLKERINNAYEAFHADEGFSSNSVAVKENESDLQKQSGANSAISAFDVWAFTKYFLFFLPGVSLLFFVTLVLTDFLIFRNENIGNFTFAFFWIGLGAFLTMFGIGKLAELKYLKVVASVLIASFAIALSFFFVPDELKGKFFGSYSLYFLPIVMLVGFAAKRWIDSQETEIS
jgi:cation transport ATPase